MTLSKWSIDHMTVVDVLPTQKMGTVTKACKEPCNNNNNLFAFPFEIRLQEIYIYFLFLCRRLSIIGTMLRYIFRLEEMMMNYYLTTASLEWRLGA